MPSREAHFTVAFILLVITFFIMLKLNLINYAGYAVALLVGSVLPDIIEPAIVNGNRKAWEHRQYFYSKRFLRIVYFSLIPLLVIGIFFNIVLYIFFLLIGYILHLWMDSTTKMRLPN